jgi:hypothetical protein
MRTVPSNLSSKKRFAWDEIYDDDDGGGSGGGMHPLAATLSMARDTSATPCCRLQVLQLLMLLNLFLTWTVTL